MSKIQKNIYEKLSTKNARKQKHWYNNAAAVLTTVNEPMSIPKSGIESERMKLL